MPWRAAAVAAALLPAVVFAPAAAADSPVTIPPGEFVVDQAGVLGSDRGQVEQAIEDLRDNAGQTLFVIYVDSFTNPSDMDAWVEEVAQTKGMGSTDSVLAVAVETRQARFKSDNAGRIAPFDEEIYREYILPNLAEDRWAEAGVQAAAGIQDATDGKISGGSGSGSNGSSGSAAPWIIGGVLVAGGGATVWALSRRRTRQPVGAGVGHGPGPGPAEPVDPLAGLSVEELRQRSGSLLVAADDAIRSSEQELGFAQAQYGDDAIRPFAEDIAAAKAHMSESFKLQQQLDDHIPDTEEEQRTWLGDIIHRCEAVNESLERHRADFEQLRELERRAPQAIASLKGQVPALRSRLATAEGTFAALAQEYAESALAQVRDNIAQAGDRLDFVGTAVADAESKLAAQQTAEAAVAIRAGEEGLHQAGVLLDAIDRAGSGLADTREALESAVSAAAQDLAQAQAQVASGRDPELSGPVAALSQALAEVGARIRAGRIDPVELLRTVEQARARIEAPLAGIRDRQEQARRAAEQLHSAIRSAQARIQGTNDFIRARRGGVGSRARTRLAEAQRNLDEALRLSSSDPVSALQYANQAIHLADQAASEAENDINGFGGGGFGGGGFGGNRGSGLGGAILGGILIDSILHGGHHGGGDGGHGGGFFGGGGFGGFGGGGGGGGGFGGGGFDGGGGGGNF
ncbi:TPM domain-containing protein [Arthrobacter ginkgonis]|uniref:TPM domain-containing protein n=1 Tax=Arthrobacter ginkgonis TaxID=1630594 RepID=A0ABP7CAU3_9MICC